MVFAIDESPLQEGVLWAGSNDGLVQVTRDGGQSWTNVTENIPGLPPWGTVSNIDASRYEAGKAYITVDFHQVNDRRPYVYKTDDYGRTWTKIVSGIPESPLSYAHCVREDPVRPGLLYVGTENALYVSFDDGASWQSLQNNLPHAPVHWIEVQEHFNDLVVSTYGRGFWILDDITPLQQLNDPVRGAARAPVRAPGCLPPTTDHPPHKRLLLRRLRPHGRGEPAQRGVDQLLAGRRARWRGDGGDPQPHR